MTTAIIRPKFAGGDCPPEQPGERGGTTASCYGTSHPTTGHVSLFVLAVCWFAVGALKDAGRWLAER